MVQAASDLSRHRGSKAGRDLHCDALRFDESDSDPPPKVRLAPCGSAWPLVGLAAPVAVNLAWIGLLAYELVKLL
jgi:hypothetical protein